MHLGTEKKSAKPQARKQSEWNTQTGPLKALWHSEASTLQSLVKMALKSSIAAPCVGARATEIRPFAVARPSGVAFQARVLAKATQVLAAQQQRSKVVLAATATANGVTANQKVLDGELWCLPGAVHYGCLTLMQPQIRGSEQLHGRFADDRPVASIEWPGARMPRRVQPSRIILCVSFNLSAI